MNNPAIHQAIRLSKYPEEMAWLCFPDSEFPEGITDLLRLCASSRQLNKYAEKNNIESKTLHKILLNFIQKAILADGNTDEKILGLEESSSIEHRKLHYQLLMRIYHPDVNSSPQAAHFSAKISNAYQRLKQQSVVKEKQTKINVSENRIPPKSYYQATQKAELQISNTKSAIALLSAITIFTLVAMMGHFYDPANPELISLSTDISTRDRETSKTNNNSVTPFRMAALSTNDNPGITDSKLQFLLRNLEIAYEKGNVALIKPILANTPAIKGQTDKELNDKLETLFEITSQRKMLLFDFNWENVSGELLGKGKFLSRYHLVGEEKWLTREGTATITALLTGNQLKVTQLELENQSIEQ
jgi:hypothetical protein